MDGEDLARPVNSDFVKKILCMMYLVFFPHQYSEVWPWILHVKNLSL
jgi:hypothetical protein